MKKFKCEWCKKDITNTRAYEAFISYDGDSYQMFFCSENHARDKAWHKTQVYKTKKLDPNHEAWK